MMVAAFSILKVSAHSIDLRQVHVNNCHHILVTGAGGFIGKALIVHLLRRGWNVRAMLRAPGRPFVSPDAAVEIVYADMRDFSALVSALEGMSVVVHLAAAKNDEKWSYDVNVGGAERLIKACRLAGCRRIINISSQSAKIERKGVYARTKYQADERIEGSGLDVTTLLPSVVYGEEMAAVFGTVVKMIRKIPVVPILGDGQWICAPVYVGDVAEAVCLCIENNPTVGRKYDIGGPNSITFNDFVNRVECLLGRRRAKVHIPFTISLLAAQILAALLPSPPVTVSNVLGSNQDTHIDISPARIDFGFDPVDLDTGLRRVLSAGTLAACVNTGKPRRSENELAAECVVLARYLVGQEPTREIVDRYIAANRILLLDQSRDQAELEFIHRHPSALPLLDAAAGFLKPESTLRKKALLLIAILEATPAHADFFLGSPQHPIQLCCSLAWQGTRAAAKALIGIPLMWVVRRS